MFQKFSYLSIYLLVIVGFISCTKDKKPMLENELTIQTSQSSALRTGSIPDPTVTNNRLIFTDADHFHSYVEMLGDSIEYYASSDSNLYISSDDYLDEIETSLGFTSFRKDYINGLTPEQYENLDSLPIDYDELASVINPGGIIQINPWIIKLDHIERNVYALHKDSTHLFTELNNNTINHPSIKKFTFDDEVLDLLDQGLSSGNLAFWGCSHSRAKRRKSDHIGCYDWTNYCSVASTVFSYRFRVKYSTFGIKENLYFKLWHKANFTNLSQFVSLRYNIIGTAQPRCKSARNLTVSEFGDCPDPNFQDYVEIPRRAGNSNGRFKRNIYNNKRALRNYVVLVNLSFTYRCISDLRECAPENLLFDAESSCIRYDAASISVACN